MSSNKFSNSKQFNHSGQPLDSNTSKNFSLSTSSKKTSNKKKKGLRQRSDQKVNNLDYHDTKEYNPSSLLIQSRYLTESRKQNHICIITRKCNNCNNYIASSHTNLPRIVSTKVKTITDINYKLNSRQYSISSLSSLSSITSKSSNLNRESDTNISNGSCNFSILSNSSPSTIQLGHFTPKKSSSLIITKKQQQASK